MEKIVDWQEYNNEDQFEKIICFINKNKGKYIYPKDISKQFNIDIMKVYEILNQLVKYDILRLAFEVYCNKCYEFQDNIYDFFNEIPRSINCRYCEGNINFNEDIIVIYKVNEDKEKVILKIV